VRAGLLALLLAGGCSTSPHGDPPEPLRVGVGQTDITPSDSYPMSGYYYERRNTGVRDRLHAKALVLVQGDERAVLVECDLASVTPELTEEVRTLASARTGIAPERINVAATHTHTGPDYRSDLRRWLSQDRAPAAYPARLIEGIAESIHLAWADLRPSQLSVGVGQQKPQVSFCRRFLMKDGTVHTWANYRDAETVREASPIDPEVSILLVGDTHRARAALVNFALHLDTLGGTLLSADFPHDMAEALKPDLGEQVITIFANGCSGNINHIDPRTDKRNPTEFIGRSLAETVKRALPSLHPVGHPRLAARRAVVEVPLQEAAPPELRWAHALVEKDQKGDKLPFLEVVRAHKLLGLERLRARMDHLSLEVHAIRLDPQTAIVTLPGEVFVEFGLDIKRRSPFETTFVVELSNTDETRYIPTRENYPLGGYEVGNSTLAPGGGEELVEAAVLLLQDLR
jgi:neutral ceramidase